VVGKCILIVDHNPASRVFLAKHLRNREFNVLEAPTGKDGLIASWRDQPDLILFDPTLPDVPGREFLQKLRGDSRTRATFLVALSSDPGPACRETCIMAGVNEYLVKSSGAILALDEILDRIYAAEEIHESPPPPPVPEKNGSLIVFLSGKGGTGTSSLCANFAMNIQQAQPESHIIVADLVLPIGSIGQIVGNHGSLNLVTVANLPPEQTNAEYFRKNLPIPELWKFQLLAGSPDPQQGNTVRGERINQIVDVLLSAYDFIILDIGRSLSRISLPLIQKADLIVLVVSTDQSTIQLTKTVCEYLQTQGIDSQKIFAVLNRAVGLEGLTKTEAEAIMGLPIKTTMPYMGSNFTLANNLNQPITIKYPTDTASIILKGTAEDMVKLAKRFQAR